MTTERSVSRERFRLITCDGDENSTGFAQAVQEGLIGEKKSLPCRYFYDEVGSAFFEKICELPEYYLTRAEREILTSQASDILEETPFDLTLVELGSGSAVKTRLLIAELLRSRDRLRFTPIDVSRSAIEASAEGLLNDFSQLEILGVAADYHTGLSILKAENSGPELILWLGSSIGNLHRDEAAHFLRGIVGTMSDEDRLLVGIDLRKGAEILESAYDDAGGVTAKFNRNVLDRINRELGGSFDLDAFRHLAIYNDDLGRIEMYLVSERSQRVLIEDLDLEISFAQGELVHTENSYKYSEVETVSLAKEAGLAINGQWFDSRKRFSLNRMSVAKRE